MAKNEKQNAAQSTTTSTDDQIIEKVESVVAGVLSDVVTVITDRLDTLEQKIAEVVTHPQVEVLNLDPGKGIGEINVHNVKPIFLNDDDRIQLEAYLGQNIDSPSHLLKLIERLCTIRFGVEDGEQLSILVSAEMLDRLDGRKMPDQSMQEFVNEIVLDEMERFVGIR